MQDAASFFQYVTVAGAQLFTMVFLPQNGGKFPTVIIRTPYADSAENLPEDEVLQAKRAELADRWLARGYAVVFQHCRGTGKSTGDCIPYIHEREDGLLLQEWIRKQPFYNGELYLYGQSYSSSVHFVTAPFAPDIKGAVLEIQDCKRYNINYRNGFYKVGLNGGWYARIYKKKSIRNKNYSADSHKTLPLSAFSQTVFGEPAEALDELLKHPNETDAFWQTRYGGGEARDAVKQANIPVLLVTGFYDIYTGGVFDMWQRLDAATKAQSALVVHPFDHNGEGKGQPIDFENGNLKMAYPNYATEWFDFARGKGKAPFVTGKVTYYKLFGNAWCCDDFASKTTRKISFATGQKTYRYNPYAPAKFAGGLSTNFGGTAWQDPPHSRYDILSFYTQPFAEDTFVKGQMKAKLKVKSTCEDTCFYIRLSLCKPRGDYGLRDDINQISNFNAAYVAGQEVEMTFTFDPHAFVVQKGEKIRVDISSSCYPHYVPHTNQKGLFSEQTTAKMADNTVFLDDAYIEIPIA